MELSEVATLGRRILDEVERAVVGKRASLELVLVGLMANGHVLLEDVPGLAKTLAARSFAQVTGLDFGRVQFTPDLMPSDITGSSVFDQRTSDFAFRPGPIFTNLVLADEINRASPKTQAALLEAMQERQISIDGTTHPLQPPFLVVATQNPVEYEGTYPLPEAQLDRFLLRVGFGYPSREAEWEVLSRRIDRQRDEVVLERVVDRDTMLAMQAAIETVHVEESIGYYMVDLVTATRTHTSVQVGASPRGSLALVMAGTRPRGEMREVNGYPATVISYKTAVTGVKTGTLTVGPITTMPVVVLPRGRQPRRRSYNDPFANPFFDDPFGQFSAPPKQITLKSNTVNVEVTGLPPGKPANFSGAIGDFKLEAEADPRKAQAGDPVTVRLILSGRGNFDRIAAPVLSDERGLRTYPATSKFKADDEVNLSGVKTFEQVVIADGARTSLPAYHFTYLDPATGKYATLDTPPVPVEIIGGNTPAPTATVASAAAAAPTATPTPTPPPKPAEDILYIRTDFGPARTASDFLPPYRRRPGSGFWLAQWIALAAFLAAPVIAGIVARARNEKARRMAQARRQQAELQRALQQENTGRAQFYEAATQLARLRAATSAGQPAGSLSVADICRAKGLDPQAAGSVEEMFHRHDELAYSGGRTAQEPVPADERRGVLATLETLEKR